MDSPLGSPITTDSSGSPPPDDFQLSSHTPQQVANAQLISTVPSFGANSGPPKRRLPGGSAFSDGSSRRDAKSRRREDTIGVASGSRRSAEGQSFHLMGNVIAPTTYQTRSEYSRQNKEELIDLPLVEQLRQDFGDPFLETVFKALS